jgi:hypothetical protein
VLAAEVPTITDWMQGWGSILGLLMSTVAVIFTGGLLRHEIRVRREEKADSDAAQARLVVAHVVGTEEPPVGRENGRTIFGPMTGVCWQIKNHSQAPIFDATIFINEWVDSRWGEVIEKEASGTAKCDPPLPLDYGPFDPREALVTVDFTDAAGLRWTRSLGAPPARVVDPAMRLALHRRLVRLIRKKRGLGEDPPS